MVGLLPARLVPGCYHDGTERELVDDLDKFGSTLEAHDIIDELVELVGHGVIPRKIGRIQALSELLGLKGSDKARVAALESALERAIQSLDGEYELDGHKLPEEGTKTAFRILLKLTRGKNEDERTRRQKAIDLLRLGRYSTDHWRKDGPEFRFMMILAEQLISLAEEQQHDYRRELGDFKIYFNEHGVMRRVEVTCEIIALEDSLTKVDAVAEYLADLNGSTPPSVLSGLAVSRSGESAR